MVSLHWRNDRIGETSAVCRSALKTARPEATIKENTPMMIARLFTSSSKRGK